VHPAREFPEVLRRQGTGVLHRVVLGGHLPRALKRLRARESIRRVATTPSLGQGGDLCRVERALGADERHEQGHIRRWARC
jgi:hypothetical protein